MVASRASRRSLRLVTLAFALVTPVGALLFFIGAGHLATAHPAWLGQALAFCAGTFLCIACADLLPELQFHSHDRVKLSLGLLAGVAVAVAVTRFGHVEHEQKDTHNAHRLNAPISLLTKAHYPDSSAPFAPQARQHQPLVCLGFISAEAFESRCRLDYNCAENKVLYEKENQH
jgi:hypothetical protein